MQPQMSGLQSSDSFFPGDSFFQSSSLFDDEKSRGDRFGSMWQERSATAVAGQMMGDYSAWDVAALEARIGSSWKEPRREQTTASRIQDIALEITDHQPDARDDGGESFRWPFEHNSPCRLFGSRRQRKRNSVGELRMHRSCSSLPASVEFGLSGAAASQSDEFRAPPYQCWASSRDRFYHQESTRDAPTPGGYNNNPKTMMVGRHRSFDETETTVLHRERATQAPPPPCGRPSIHRAMSIDEVLPPDQPTASPSSSPSKRRRGRRPVSQPLEEEEQPVDEPQPPHPKRDLLTLLRNGEAIAERDLQSRENRQILHYLVYQQTLNVCFQDLVDHVQEDIENDPEEAFLRPPIPMFIDG